MTAMVLVTTTQSAQQPTHLLAIDAGWSSGCGKAVPWRRDDLGSTSAMQHEVRPASVQPVLRNYPFGQWLVSMGGTANAASLCSATYGEVAVCVSTYISMDPRVYMSRN